MRDGAEPDADYAPRTLRAAQVGLSIAGGRGLIALGVLLFAMGGEAMKFGAQVSCYRTTWDDIRAVIETMEAGRWHSLYHADHFVPPNAPRSDEPLTAYEGYSLIAAAAAMTERLRLGHLVLGNTYRNPALVAKMAGTIDQISHGRFTLAIGAGWFQREHEAYGWAFPSMRERSDRLEEAAELIHLLFTSEEPVTFEGQYYQLDDAPLSPNGVQQPIPLLIGGTGPKRTLRTLAMYGDVFNLDGFARRGMSVELLREKREILERHCERIGRDHAEIRVTMLVPTKLTDDQREADEFVELIGPKTVAGSADYIVQRLGEFVDEGVDEVMFGRLPKHLVLLGLVALSVSCTRLPQAGAAGAAGGLPVESLADEISVPSEWGNLIDVTEHPSLDQLWLWFQDDEGSIRVVEYNVGAKRLWADATVIHRR